jgi:hypothetical protein
MVEAVERLKENALVEKSGTSTVCREPRSAGGIRVADEDRTKAIRRKTPIVRQPSSVSPQRMEC